MGVKTTIVLPDDLYRELKRRAVEEGRPMRDLIVDALLNYLSRRRGLSVKDLILKPVDGMEPEDLREYEGEDID
ncbi:MAG: hypothetical protein QXX87_00995 [Candidatus Jordarchaeales archaeon]|nr:hypothetical protein [Candidatus Jordarchaeia archaeon]